MSISPFPNPSRFPPIEDLPLLEEVTPLAHHKHGIVASKYATAYDCSSLLTVAEEGDENNSLLREIKEFYDEYGYVVLQDVFNSHQCERTRDAMWEILEQANPGMKRDDQESWNALKSKGRYGLSTRGPSFHPTLVENRQHPILVKLLALLTEAKSSHDVITSHDRFTIYRATMRDENPQSQNVDFSTGDKNLHLDLNPWWWDEDSIDVIKGVETIQYNDNQDFVKENNLVVKSMGRHVQCVLNFADNVAEDGGTIVVPYFHRYMSKWCEVHKKIRKNLPWVTLPKDVEGMYMPYAQRISMKEGSVLVWDQRVLHGTCPNQSSRCRLAQYLKAGPRHATYGHRDASGNFVSDSVVPYVNPRLLRRTKALIRELEISNAFNVISPDIGRYVFALDILEDAESSESK